MILSANLLLTTLLDIFVGSCTSALLLVGAPFIGDKRYNSPSTQIFQLLTSPRQLFTCHHWCATFESSHQNKIIEYFLPRPLMILLADLLPATSTIGEILLNNVDQQIVLIIDDTRSMALPLTLPFAPFSGC